MSTTTEQVTETASETAEVAEVAEQAAPELQMTEKPTVILTEKAAGELNRVLTEQKATLPENPVVRIRLAAGGCSGFEYGLGIDDAAKVNPEADEVSEQFGIKMIVDKKSSIYLAGTVMDYYESLEKRGFTFENPNATKSCGCGSSFSV